MSGTDGEVLNGRRAGSRLGILIAAALAGVIVAGAGIAAEVEKKEAEKEQSQAELEHRLQEARQQLDAAAQEVARISMSLSEDAWPVMRRFADGGPNRALLGINIGSSGRGDAPTDGVEIASVSPGGAAADAGLKSGDVLTEVNGKSLKRDGDESPREKLMTEMRQVKPGGKVAVTYRRDGKVAKATVVAQPLADRLFTMATPAIRGSVGVGPMGHMQNFTFMRNGGVFGSAELVPLTPKLGQYFGAEKGLLVVRAPADSRFKLEDGDVIVDIDGRTPSSPMHALRILGSYQPGEKLKLNVLRSKKKMSFDVTVPEDTWERPIGGASFRGEPDQVIMPAPGIRVVPPAVTAPAPMHMPPPAPGVFSIVSPEMEVEA